MADKKKLLGGLGKMGKRIMSTDEERLNALMSHSGDNVLPLKLPRANLSDEFIDQQADRVARQMLGEHVRSGKPKDTTNLAGRSKKESERLKGLNYKLTPIGTVAKEKPYTPRKGDVKVAFPGDQTVSDKILNEVEGFPIDSQQQGGAYYGLGQKHLKDPEFWKSTETPAKNVQAKVDRVAELFEPERVIGSHLAMGPTANNFAMHFADANLRAIDWSKAQPKNVNVFDSIIAGGYKDPKTGELVSFPNWPGLADREGALAAMKEDSNLRKWFNNRMKTPAVTEPLGLPNGLDIQYAITEPRIRDMEINMTGLMTGELKPKALVEAAGTPHNTYSHRILGEALGPQEVLTPFVLDFPDAAQHIASTKRPSDFSSTIQKVFPHQVVDDQFINQYNQYRERIKKLTGQKKGGVVDIKAADARLSAAISKRMAKGGAVDIEAADARLESAIAQRMAGGGEVGFKKLQFMAGGGKVKGAAKVFKRIFADDVLPAAERDANLAKMLAESKIPQRLYHGTGDDIKEFRNSRIGAMGPGTYLAESPQNASAYSTITNRKGSANKPNVMPVYVQAKNPFVISDVNKSHEELFKYFDPEGKLTDDEVIKKVLNLGYDSIYAKGTGEINVLDPRKIKSAIGNRGTYDTSDPDITKAEGGGAFKKIQFMDKGGITTSGGTFTPEELGVSAEELGISDKRMNQIKRNIAKELGTGKEQIEKEYRQLGNKGGKKDFAIRVGSQIAGGGVDLANLGLESLDFLQSLVPALSKPESVLDTAGTGDRVPKFKLAFDDPALGSEGLIKKFKEAKLLGENEFPLTETIAGFAAPAAAVSALRKGKQAYKGAKALMDTPKKRQGGLTAMAR